MKIMKTMKFMLVGLVMVLALGLTGVVMANNITTTTVTYQVTAINEIIGVGGPVSLIVDTATAGSEPDSDTDSSTSYSITTNGTGKKITGKINSLMPDNVTLKVGLAAPSGGTSLGNLPMILSDTDLVTGITHQKGTSLTITYILSATLEAGVVESGTKTLTLTITSG